LTATLDPDDYGAKTHSVTVLASKGGRPYSWSSAFTVQAAGGGGGIVLGPFNVAEFVAAAQGIAENTPSTPVTLVLQDTEMSILNAFWVEFYNAFAEGNADALGERYFVADLSLCSMTIISSDFMYLFDNNNFVGVILPATVTQIYPNAFRPPLTGLVRVTLNSAPTVDNISFPNGASFVSVYDGAGTYVLNGTTWSKE
jgi:hypothetical protein